MFKKLEFVNMKMNLLTELNTCVLFDKLKKLKEPLFNLQCLNRSFW